MLNPETSGFAPDPYTVVVMLSLGEVRHHLKPPSWLELQHIRDHVVKTFPINSNNRNGMTKRVTKKEAQEHESIEVQSHHGANA